MGFCPSGLLSVPQAHDGSFFSHLSKFFFSEHKKSKKHDNFNFLLNVGFTLFLSSQVFLLGIKWVET